jgi:hypothetical protein
MAFQSVGVNGQHWLRELDNLERQHPTSVHQPAKNCRRALAHLVLLEEAIADPEINGDGVIQRRFLAIEGYAKEALGLNREVPEQLMMLRLAPEVRSVGLAWAGGRNPLDIVQDLRELRKPIQPVVFDRNSTWNQHIDSRLLHQEWVLAKQKAKDMARADHGLRRCCIHLALLEEHLTDGDMYCGDCIRKHLTAASLYALEGGAPAIANNIGQIGDNWLRGGRPEQAAFDLAVIRNNLQPYAFAIGIQG